jgi:hypothetical protein
MNQVTAMQWIGSSNRSKYKYTIVLDRNDPRLIDVGIMSSRRF